MIEAVDAVEVEPSSGAGPLRASRTGELGTEETGEPGKETHDPGMKVTWMIGLG